MVYFLLIFILSFSILSLSVFYGLLPFCALVSVVVFYCVYYVIFFLSFVLKSDAYLNVGECLSVCVDSSFSAFAFWDLTCSNSIIWIVSNKKLRSYCMSGNKNTKRCSKKGQKSMLYMANIWRAKIKS